MRFVLMSFVLCVLTVATIRFRQLRADARKRSEARAAWEARRAHQLQGQRNAALLREVDRCFPFVRPAVDARIKTGEKLRDAVRRALEELDGVHLGTTDGGLPVVLPAGLRSRHVLLLGKSGYGKSTTMVHMICEDLK